MLKHYHPILFSPESRKKPISPKVPMKPLYWTRIQCITAATPKSSPEEETKYVNSGAKVTEILSECVIIST